MASEATPMAAGVAALPRRFRRAFVWRVGWRLVLLACALAALAWAVTSPALPAAAAVCAAAAALAAASLWREVQRTNHELARLLSALRHGDFGERFDGVTAADAGFADLAAAAQALLARQQALVQAEQRRGAERLAVLEQVPMPLLAVDEAGRVSLLNHAARRLLGPGAADGGGVRAAEFSAFGAEFVALLEGRGAPPSTVALRPQDDAGARLRVACSQALLDGRPQRLIALQAIQAELDDAEARLSSGLVRVLTHEVMNSLTPVVSLLRTAAELGSGRDATTTANSRAQLQRALETAARRSEGLLGFVERFRALSRPLEVHKAPLALAILADTLAQLFRAEWSAQQVLFELRLGDAPAFVAADGELLEPVLMNLLRNAAQAATGHAPAPRVRLSMQRAASGRVLMDIEDNGPGIAPAARDEVFLPFFTTKPDGHGVGLALARQAVLAHGGSIDADASADLGGARLRIVL